MGKRIDWGTWTPEETAEAVLNGLSQLDSEEAAKVILAHLSNDNDARTIVADELEDGAANG